jgi:hydroxypyruvate isomerase
MWHFSANLTTLWSSLPFEHRIAEAARAGFTRVECAYPYDYDPRGLRRASDAAGVTWSMINLPAGDSALGERGLACRPARGEAFRASVETGLRYADTLGARRLTCMVGLVAAGEDAAALWALTVTRLRWAARRLAPHGAVLQVEALNPVDAPGFLLARPAQAADLVADVGAPNVAIQFDAYHALRTEPDVLLAMRSCGDRLGHVHVADLPDRAQPGTGPLPVEALFSALDDLGFEGDVGLEYALADGGAEAFDWLAPWKQHLRSHAS